MTLLPSILLLAAGIALLLLDLWQVSLAFFATALVTFILWAVFRSRYSRLAHAGELTGAQFEELVADIMKQGGFRHVELTKSSGDYGVDILAVRDSKSYAVQCKHLQKSVGVSAVQQVSAGVAFYGCDVGVVAISSHFTQPARELAESTGVILWDMDDLYKGLG